MNERQRLASRLMDVEVDIQNASKRPLRHPLMYDDNNDNYNNDDDDDDEVHKG